MKRIAAVLMGLAVVLLGFGASQAQLDLAKALVGKWEGEMEYLYTRSGDPKRVLVIESVKQTDGRWIAEGQFGTAQQMGRVRIDVESSGNSVSLKWVTRSGSDYFLNLMQEKYLVGKATIPMDQGRSVRQSSREDRAMKLEKVK